MFCPYEVVTISWKRIGRAVACVQLVEVLDVVVFSVVDVDVALVVEGTDVVVVVEQAELQMEQAEEASMYTRGRPEVIGTAILPLESTVTAVQVYISISFVPAEYPLPLRVKVYGLPKEPRFERIVTTCEPLDPFFIAIVLLSV